MARCWVTVALTIGAGCAEATTAIPDLVHVEGATVLIASGSETLSQPVDITSDSAGNFYVLDRLRAQILVFTSAGVLLETIGREGSGPREFRSPISLTVTPDTVRVVDVGNGVLQTLARSSDFERRTPLPLGTSASPIALTNDGHLLGGTLGAQGTLAILQDPSGNEAARLGQLSAPVTMMLDLNQMKRDLIEGELPAIVRNATLPAFAPNGDLWLILTGQGITQRYSRGGTLMFAVPFETPEKDAIWTTCLERNQEFLNDPRRICTPSYATDAFDDGETLWVLLNMPEEEPAAMVGFSSTGALVHRIQFRDVTGARHFALDTERSRILFAVPSRASVVTAPMPGAS